MLVKSTDKYLLVALSDQKMIIFTDILTYVLVALEGSLQRSLRQMI